MYAMTFLLFRNVGMVYLIMLCMVNVLKSYTKVSDKMAYANSADPDPTADLGLHCLPFH